MTRPLTFLALYRHSMGVSDCNLEQDTVQNQIEKS